MCSPISGHLTFLVETSFLFFMKIELLVFLGGPSSLCKMPATKVFCTSFYIGLRKHNAGLRIDEFFLRQTHDTWCTQVIPSQITHPLNMVAAAVPRPPWGPTPGAAACDKQPERCATKDCIIKTKICYNYHFISLPSSHDAVWFVRVCASRINLPTQNIMLTNLNALSLACTKSSIGSMQVGFLTA